MEEFINFIEQKPLYFRLTEGIPAKQSEIYPDKIEFYCSVCKTNRPFHKPGYGKGKRYVGQESGVDRDARDEAIRSVFSEVINSLFSGIYELKYDCSGCFQEQFLCWIEVNTSEKWIRKVGQVPPWSKNPDSNLTKLISSHRDYYRKGLACESHSYGIGAYSYYRRIVEEVIDDLLNSIEDLIEPSEKETYSNALNEVKNTIVAKEKIALVKDLLPSVLRPEDLNPLSILHSSLSDGIHNESDEKCLESAQHIREVLEFLTTQIEIHRESSKVFTESMRKILDRKNT
jgi:hypothetical protein